MHCQIHASSMCMQTFSSDTFLQNAMHKKLSFLCTIFRVNVAKSAGKCVNKLGFECPEASSLFYNIDRFICKSQINRFPPHVSSLHKNYQHFIAKDEHQTKTRFSSFEIMRFTPTESC